MKRLVVLLFLGMVLGGFCAETVFAAALIPGASYTIEIYPIKNDGSIGARSSSTTVSADANRKLTFSLTNLPNFPTYNFLLVRTKDADGNIVRQGIVPAPPAGEETLLGVSPASVSQTRAMLKAMEDAGSDDPVMVLFGFTLIRTGALDDEDIAAMGDLARQAVLDGFNAFLEDKVGATKMQAFRNAVQKQLGDYTAKIKDLIDSADDDEKENLRGEAGAMLSRFLVEAAAAAGFDPGLIPPAMKAMSDQAERHVASLSEGMTVCMDVVMASTYMKIMAEVVKQKYSSGLEVLGASADQIERMNVAIDNLSNALVWIFTRFESLFANEEVMPSVGELKSRMEEMNMNFELAFSNFMAESASSVEELDEMIASIQTRFCPSTENETICINTLDSMKGSDPNYLGDHGFFQIQDLEGGRLRWPIPMVVAVKWVADNHPRSFSYSRDDLIPAPKHWVNRRGNYTSEFVPLFLTDILGLREDIEIVYGRRMAGEIAASCDITQDDWNALPTEDQDDPEIQAMLNGTDHLDRVLRIASTENTAIEDDADGLNTELVPGFNHCDDMAPFLNGYEIQGLEEILLERLENLKSKIGPSAVTEAQRQALIDVLSTPRFR